MQRDGITVTILRSDFDDLIGQNKKNAVSAYKFIFADIFTKVWKKSETVNPNVEKAFIERGATSPSLLPPPPPSLLPPPPPSLLPPPTSLPPPPPPLRPQFPSPQIYHHNSNTIWTFPNNTHQTKKQRTDTKESERQRDPNYRKNEIKLVELKIFVNNLLKNNKLPNVFEKDIKKMEKLDISPEPQITYIKNLMIFYNFENVYNKFEKDYNKKIRQDAVEANSIELDDDVKKYINNRSRNSSSRWK